MAVAALFRTLARLLSPHSKVREEPTRTNTDKHVRIPTVAADFEKLKAEERLMEGNDFISVSVLTGGTNSQYDLDQEKANAYSKQAVAFKKEKQWDAAVDSMMEEYEIAAKYPENAFHVEYMRLPLYLQSGGRSDEGWHWLVNYALGILPSVVMSRQSELCSLVGVERLKIKSAFFLKEKKTLEKHMLLGALISSFGVLLLQCGSSVRRKTLTTRNGIMWVLMDGWATI